MGKTDKDTQTFKDAKRDAEDTRDLAEHGRMTGADAHRARHRPIKAHASRIHRVQRSIDNHRKNRHSKQ